ncbi:MAG TPA: GAF domain-containing sensor histidine kinase [Solirubrobacteraceae bacterium]
MDRMAREMLDVACGVLAELDLEVVLDRVLRAAKDLTDAQYAALGLLNESRTELIRFITLGVDDQTHAAIGALPRGRGVLQELIDTPRALRLDDVASHPRSYGFPPAHPLMRSFLGVPIPIDGTPIGNLYLTEKRDGEPFTADDEETVVMLAEFAGVAIDHARRHAGARDRREELERTVAALEATTQIARAVGGETDLEVILELVAKRGLALACARVLLIELTQQDELIAAAGAGELPEGILGNRIQLQGSLAGHALGTRRVQRLEDEGNRIRFEEHGSGQLGLTAEDGLVVPLVFKGHAYGALLVLDRLQDGPRFTAEDQRLLESFAASAATAVATAQSAASERSRQRLAAAEAERSRWARELHDDTLQSLSALRVSLSSSARSGDLQTLGQKVTQAIDYLEETISNLRALIADLRPAALDELGTQAALQALAESSTRHGLEVDVSIDLDYEQGRLATRHIPELETAFYRIAQEALTNAAKHGGARHAVLELHEQGGAVTLSVHDDGDGFDPSAKTEGFGLLGMRERAQLLGGEFELDSKPGRGTTIKVCLPALRRR